jgi:hypothetical protein
MIFLLVQTLIRSSNLLIDMCVFELGETNQMSTCCTIYPESEHIYFTIFQINILQNLIQAYIN